MTSRCFQKQLPPKSINASRFISHQSFLKYAEGIDFAIGRFHIGAERKRRNKTHLIFARSFRRCRGVYWCRVPLAWGLPKYQSHTRLQIIYVYIARAYSTRHLHDDEIRRRRRGSSHASFFFARNTTRIFLIHSFPAYTYYVTDRLR